MKTLENVTKEQRHEVYKEALRILESIDEYFMCICIKKAAAKVLAVKYDSVDISDYPDFIALKPKRKFISESWFPKDNRQIRIDNFNKIIEQTKP